MLRKLFCMICVLALAVPASAGMAASAHTDMVRESANATLFSAHADDTASAIPHAHFPISSEQSAHPSKIYGTITKPAPAEANVSLDPHCCENRAGHCGTVAFLIGSRFDLRIFSPEKTVRYPQTTSWHSLGPDTETPPPKA